MRPIDFHCHGISKFDFTEPSKISLANLDEHLEIEGTSAILTLYLRKDRVQNLDNLIKEYHAGYIKGIYKNIRGIALEGPLLSSFGGTPKVGQWIPTKEEWRSIFELGKYGLCYIVISPDYQIDEKNPSYPDSIEWIMEEMLRYNILPALGHFRKDNPEYSANSIKNILRYVKENNLPPIVTDHLYNDMPLNFKHSFRNQAEREKSDEALQKLLSADWHKENLEDILGAVPAAIIQGAKEGLLKICLNFDGDHVDIRLCKKTVEYVGSENLMIMTDRIQSKILGGQYLTERLENTLLYQEAGIVAGGTQSLMRQIMNMLQVNLNSKDIYNLIYQTAHNLLQIQADIAKKQKEYA